MALITPQDVALSAGLANITFAAANASDTIGQAASAGGWEAGPVLLVVKNGNAAAITVTITDGAGATRQIVSIPATTGIGVARIAGVAAGTVQTVTYSLTASVTVGAVRLTG